MKRFHHVVLVFATVALLLTAQPLNGQIHGENCNHLVMNHSFSQGFEGFLNAGFGLVPTAGAGFVTFLPQGKVKGQVTLAIGQLGLLQDLVFGSTSQYSLSWDTTKTPALCSGAMTLNAPGEAPFNFQLLVTQDGQQIEMIHTDAGLIVGVTGFPVDTRGCSNYTLNGKYSYNSKGWALAPPGVPPNQLLAGYLPLAMSGAIEFHPRVSPSSTSGSVVWWDTASVNGIIVPRTGKGSYKVNPDCTGTVVLTTDDPTPGQVFNLELFVGKHGEALDLVNIDPGWPPPVVLSSRLTRADQDQH